MSGSSLRAILQQSIADLEELTRTLPAARAPLAALGTRLKAQLAGWTVSRGAAGQPAASGEPLAPR